MADRVAANPSAYKPTASVYRVPSNGDAGAALYIDSMPLADLSEAPAWLARHSQGGPGVYRVDVRDNQTARSAMTVLVRVISDLRQPTRPQVERLEQQQQQPQDIARIVREVVAQELRHMNGAPPGPLSSMMGDPFAALEKLADTARRFHGAPTAEAADPTRLVRLGLDMAREAAAAAGGSKKDSFMAAIVEKHMDDIMELGKGGLELARELVKQRKPRSEPPTTTEEPTPDEPTEPDAVEDDDKADDSGEEQPEAEGAA